MYMHIYLNQYRSTFIKNIQNRMGKKGVILDNGKSAQSSMALYWKNGRERQKNPKEKVEKEVDEEKQLDDRVENGLEKWKIHKQKLITKGYIQKKQKEEKSQSEKIAEETTRQEQAYEKQMMEKYSNQDKPISIPGFKNKAFIKTHLSFQILKEPDQSNNKLILPPSVGDLSQQEIIRILREKKNKREEQKLAKTHEEYRVKQAHRHLPDDFHVLLGDDVKEEQEEIQRKQREQQERKKKEEQRIKKEQQNKRFFKSDILHQIEKGDYSALVKKVEPIAPVQQQKIENIQQKSESKSIHFQSKFIPRALKK